MRCGRGYGGQLEGGDEWEFGTHQTNKRWYEQAKLKQLRGYQEVRPNGRLRAMAYASGKVEEHRALLTINQKVELVVEMEGAGYVKVKVKVDAVEGKAALVTPAAKVKQGRKEVQLRLQEEAVRVAEVKGDEQGELAVRRLLSVEALSACGESV